MGDDLLVLGSFGSVALGQDRKLGYQRNVTTLRK